MNTAYDAPLSSALETSYRTLLGESFPVPPDVGDAAQRWEWIHLHAPFALLAHEIADDPRFIYANRSAQRLFGYPEDEFFGTPSRLSACAGHDREERDRLFADLEERDYCAGYRGRRVTKSGATFWIEDSVVWNVRDESGVRLAQAAILLEVSSPQRP